MNRFRSLILIILLVAVLVVATVAPAAAQSVPVQQGQWVASAEPPPEDAPDEVTTNDKDTIVGDININPDALPAEQISLNHIIIEPPRPTGVTADDVTAQDKETIVGDIDVDPSGLPAEQISLNGGGTIIKIVVPSKRAVSYDPIDELPPCWPNCRNLN